MRSGRGSKGETLSRGFPLFLYASTCAPFSWAVVVALPCHSTPFLWCLPKETVSSRQRKALFYPGGSTIRVSATSRWTIRSSPDLGRGFLRVRRYVGRFSLACPAIRPHFFCLAKRNGVEPPKKSALKPPHHPGGPTRLSHSALSPNGTNWCVKLVCTWWVN